MLKTDISLDWQLIVSTHKFSIIRSYYQYAILAGTQNSVL